MEDYIRANQQQFGLKAEERIIKTEHEEPLKLNIRKEEGMAISLSPTGVKFTFDTSDEQIFLKILQLCPYDGMHADEEPL